MQSVDCRLCSSPTIVVKLPSRPLINDLQSTSDGKFEVDLSLCGSCGFIRLDHQIPDEDFYSTYATPSSWKKVPHLDSLLRTIEELASSKHSPIIEIGSNDGSLLSTLQDADFSNLLGIEPSKFGSYKNTDKIRVIKDYFGRGFRERYAEFLKEKPSLVISRHVIEHVPDLNSFMEALVQICSPETKVLIEVPHSYTFLKEQDIAFWEEHRNHFTRENLINLFQKFGFLCLSWKEIIFSGRAQMAIFEFSRTINETRYQQTERVTSTQSEISNLLNRLDLAKSKFNALVDSVHKKSGRVILFGVGSRSMGSLWSIDSVGGIDVFIDSSPGKVGFTVPGTSKSIDSEIWLENLEPKDLVLLGVNLEDEQSVIAKIGERCQVLSLLSPSGCNWLEREY